MVCRKERGLNGFFYIGFHLQLQSFEKKTVKLWCVLNKEWDPFIGFRVNNGLSLFNME